MLLINIYNRHTESYFELPDDAELPHAEKLKPPSLKNCVANLLRHIGTESLRNRDIINQISASLKSTSSAASSSDATPSDIACLRRIRAKEAREAMVRKMQLDSKNFISKLEKVASNESLKEHNNPMNAGSYDHGLR